MVLGPVTATRCGDQACREPDPGKLGRTELLGSTSVAAGTPTHHRTLVSNDDPTRCTWSQGQTACGRPRREVLSQMAGAPPARATTVMEGVTHEQEAGPG